MNSQHEGIKALIADLERVAGVLEEYEFEDHAAEGAGLMNTAADALAALTTGQGIDAPSVREAIGEVLADMEAVIEDMPVASDLAALTEITDAAIRAAVSPPSRTAKHTGYETVGHAVGEHSQTIRATAALTTPQEPNCTNCEGAGYVGSDRTNSGKCPECDGSGSAPVEVRQERHSFAQAGIDRAQGFADGLRGAVVPDAREHLHAKCDCVPDLGPAHCHLCGNKKGEPVPWPECLAVRAAVPAEAEWEYSWEGEDNEGPYIVDAAFESADEARTEGARYPWIGKSGARMVRRRKAGPWEVVPDDVDSR